MNTHHKVIVIGSGPGGAIAALTLAEKGVPVTLLEEGSHLPDLAMFSLHEVQQKYRDGGQTLLFGKPTMGYVEGRCVGGGSEINSGLYHRTPAHILDRWNLPHVEDAHFLYAEELLSVNAQVHDSPPYSFKLEEGAKALGWPHDIAPKWFVWDEATQQSRRQSITEVLLPRLVQLGVTIHERTRVKTLKKTGGHWEIHCDTARYTAEHVVLAAGAIQSPLILRRSGFKKGIGNTLTCHPTVKVVAAFEDKVNGLGYGMGVHQVKTPDGSISFGSSVSLPAHLSVLLKDLKHGLDMIPRWEHLGVFYAMIPGQSKGKVRRLPFSASPRVSYQLDRHEIQQLKLGQQHLETLLREAGCVACFPASLNALMTIHLMGSIPLNGPLNAYGELNEAAGLLVADASVVPTSLGVNPQGTVMALSRRNALHYYEEALHG